MRKLFCILILLSFIAFQSGCATLYNPATGRNEMIFISDEQEVDIGKGVETEVLKKYRLLNDPARLATVQAIGKKITAVCDRPNMPYQFSIVDDKTVNAFAVPGGHIYIHKGLLDKLNQDELAFVLGHEVGHVTARHAIKRIQANMGFQMLLTLAFIGAGKASGSSLQNMANLSSTLYNLVALGYSREDEYLSDHLGVKYMRLAGFNPTGAVGALEKLKSEGGSWHVPFLSSHPPLDERVKNVKKEIAALSN